MTPPPPPLPERSKRLHNFNLPWLRWGQQRFLRCVKLQQHLPPSSPSCPSSPSPDRTIPLADSSNRAIRIASGAESLRLVGKVNVSVIGGGGGGEGYDSGVVAARPWNLRTRRAACNEPREEPAGVVLVDSSPPRRRESSFADLKAIDRKRNDRKEEGEKVKFSVSLMREEIEEDFAAMIGKRPPRRPKKRPRIVQKQLNSLFPGLWLTDEVTVDSYNVPEIAET